MKQEERIATSKNKILEASILEFGSNGYHETSTNTICARCEISKGLLFYHFNSKKSLFAECVAYCIDHFDQFMQEKEIMGDTVLSRLKECCERRKKFFVENPYYYRIFCKAFFEKSTAVEEEFNELLPIYRKHTYDIIEKILRDVPLNSRLERERSIQCAILMLEAIDVSTVQGQLEPEPLEDVLDKQMQKYEDFLEILLYGILE